MNIPVIPVGEVQGLPAGAIPGVTAGTVAGSLGNDFAITFGATLRQSEQQGDPSLQKSDAKSSGAYESGKLAGSTTQSSGLGTTTLQSGKTTGTLSELKAASLKAGDVETAIESQTKEIVAPKPEYEAATAEKTVEDLSTKSAVATKSEALETSNKKTAPLKTTLAAIQTGLKNSIPSTVASRNIFSEVSSSKVSSSNKTGSAENTGINTAQTPPVDAKKELAAALQNEATTVQDLRNGLATVLETSASGIAVLSGVPTKSSAAKTPELSTTVAKTQGAKTAGKASPQSVPDRLPSVAVPSAIAATPVVSAPGTASSNILLSVSSLSAIDTAGSGLSWTNKSSNPADSGSPVLPVYSVGKTNGLAPVISSASDDQTHVGEKAAASESDAEFQAAAQTASQAVTKSQSPTAAVTQAIATSALTARWAEPPVPNSKLSAAATSTNGHLSLNTAKQPLELKAAHTDSNGVDSVQKTDTSAAISDKPPLEKPIEEQAVAGATEVAKTISPKVLSQEPAERVKLPSASATGAQSPQSDVSGAGTPIVPAAASAAASHAPDHYVPPASLTGVNTVAANPTAPALQGTAPGTTSIVPTHATAGASTASASSSSAPTLEAGRLSGAATASPTEPYRTIVATPTTLEVGVPNGTQGWLRIRAEVGDQGGVNASLLAGTNSGQEMLHRQLPALNDYLHSEQIAVTTSVADRVVATAGSSLAGMAAGSNGAGSSDASGRSFNQDATANQGAANQSAMTMSSSSQSGTQGDGGQRDLVPAFEATSISASRSYDNTIGASDAAVTQTTRDGESGRWLNVRA